MYTASRARKGIQNSEAENLFARIPTGRAHPLKGATKNRAFRRMVEEANNSGKEIIINVGNGYYRPDIYDEGDLEELNEYLSKEFARAREVLGKANVMKKTLEALQKGEM